MEYAESVFSLGVVNGDTGKQGGNDRLGWL